MFKSFIKHEDQSKNPYWQKNTTMENRRKSYMANQVKLRGKRSVSTASRCIHSRYKSPSFKSRPLVFFKWSGRLVSSQLLKHYALIRLAWAGSQLPLAHFVHVFRNAAIHNHISDINGQKIKVQTMMGPAFSPARDFRWCFPMHFLWKLHVLASLCPWWQVTMLSHALSREIS